MPAPSPRSILPQAPWWQAPAQACESARRSRASGAELWFRFGDGRLHLLSEDSLLAERFLELYGELQSPPAEPGLVELTCRVQVGEAVSVEFVPPEPLDYFQFALDQFPQHGYVVCERAVAGWRMLALQGASEPVLAMKAGRLLTDRRHPWQAFAGNCAITSLFQAQPGVLFFHAGSVGVRGQGVMLVGLKGSGKTTISLALAARGHSLLGDETAAVRVASRELLPYRRALSIRPGPQAAAVAQALAGKHLPEEVLPDGSHRVRIRPAELFPSTEVAPVPLRTIFLLRSLGARAHAEAFRAGPDQLKLFSPLSCCLWGNGKGRRMMQVLGLLSQAKTYYLDMGPPDQTAELVDSMMEE